MDGNSVTVAKWLTILLITLAIVLTVMVDTWH